MKDVNELKQKIHEMEKQAEAARRKRNTITITAFTLVFFLLFYLDEKPDGFGDAIGLLVAAFFVSGLYFGINAAIFGGLYEKSEGERRLSEQLKKELREKENELFEQRIAEAKKNLH